MVHGLMSSDQLPALKTLPGGSNERQPDPMTTDALMDQYPDMQTESHGCHTARPPIRRSSCWYAL